MFQLINEDLSHLGDIELTYAVSDVWDMVQKSNVVGNGQTSLEDKNNFELFTIFLNLIGHVMEINPRKLLIIVENIDHLSKCNKSVSNMMSILFCRQAWMDMWVVTESYVQE